GRPARPGPRRRAAGVLRAGARQPIRLLDRRAAARASCAAGRPVGRSLLHLNLCNPMKEAVIVSTARTGIGRAYKGSLNATKSPSLLGHAIAHAVQRAGVEGDEVEDVVVGSVLTAGTAGMNLARNALL